MRQIYFVSTIGLIAARSFLGRAYQASEARIYCWSRWGTNIKVQIP